MSHSISSWLFLSGKKTYIMGVSAIAYAWLGCLLQHVDFQTAMKMTEDAILAMGLRHGIATSSQ